MLFLGRDQFFLGKLHVPEAELPGCIEVMAVGEMAPWRVTVVWLGLEVVWGQTPSLMWGFGSHWSAKRG